MHDTKFANPKLAEIAESFYVRPGNVWASIGKELLAYLAMAIGVCVLGPVMMACFSVPSALFGVLANVIVMEPYK